MKPLDYSILVGFMIWLLVIGAVFSRRMKSSSDMFAAGGQSPWWISGLSGFMTIFSAGTFVVWGGIGYRLGLVVVSLLSVTGMSTILVGFFVATHWRGMGITTPTEYLRIRFSESVVQVYTWVGIVFRGIGLGVGLYSLAVMLAVLVPLPEGAPLRDAETGNLSVAWSIVIWGAIVIAYTMAGGLWAVMMTDVIQCIILCLLVLVAVPLSLTAVGGVDRLWNEAPPDFFSPAAGEYTYGFLFLWFWLGFFRYAADWAFVQRYICVPTPRDARKVAFLMGGLYAVSPIFWMLPAMAYRVLTADAEPKDAYVKMCQHILPTGMLGIMMAAMFSATASMVSSLLNVFAGVFVCDVYRPFINPKASETRLVLVGRLATLIYGAAIIAVALLIPRFGGAEKVVLVLVTALLGPLCTPVVWGLYSKRIDQRAIWSTLGICFVATLLVKLGPGWLQKLGVSTAPPFDQIIALIKDHARLIDAFVGLVLPLIILAVMELTSRVGQVDPGWRRMASAMAAYDDRPAIVAASRLPALLVAASLGMLGATMSVVALLASKQRMILAVFAALLLVVAAGMAWVNRRTDPPQEPGAAKTD